MGSIDWSIVLGLFLMVIVVALWARRYNRSVADFMVANRCAGRYVLAVANGMGWFGAVTIVGYWERNYEAGFAPIWWGLLGGGVMLVIRMSGFVVYRFRETRAMTLAQFFQLRYSRAFRIFAGFVCFGGGLINFGIFPSIGARFFVYFCELPEKFQLGGFELFGAAVPAVALQTEPVIMLGLLLTAVTCTLMGGQIAVMLTDFFQGIFTYLTVVVILAFLFLTFGWDQIGEALKTAPPGQSLVNPFDTTKLPDFTLWFFLIQITLHAYGTMGWQGTQGYNSAARTPHEQRMANVLGAWRIMTTGALLLFGPIVVYTIMHHPNLFQNIATNVQASLDTIGNENIRTQMTVPIALTMILPIGLKGMLVAMVLAAFISTHDTYLHSWGTMFIQDVVMPWRKKPFSPRRHMLLLRISVVCVAIYAFFFSLLWDPAQKLQLFFSITGAIFLGGAGAVIIGGLYWRRGRTLGAWGAMITSCTVAPAGLILLNRWKVIAPWLVENQAKLAWLPGKAAIIDIATRHAEKFPLNAMHISGIAACCCVIVYVVLSLLKRDKFNLERMLHRDKYAVGTSSSQGSSQNSGAPSEVSQEPRIRPWLRRLGLSREFTTMDKVVFAVTITWAFGWAIVFVIGCSIYGLSKSGVINFDFNDSLWIRFWQIKVYILFSMVIAVVTLFLVGGFADLKKLVISLRTIRRDERDDGMVVGRLNRDDVPLEETPGAAEAEAPGAEDDAS